MYQIIVTNKQGAQDGATRKNKREINSYLKTWWLDPQNLTAVVVDENQVVIGEKPLGRKTIKWA